MHKNSVRSFHFDCTYKCVSPTPNKYRLLVLSGYDNISKKTVLCSFILCEDEIYYVKMKKVWKYF